MSTPDRWIGRTIGRFHIFDRLAVGGMSVVYRAYDPERLQEVALKMLLDSYLDNATVRARFAQEIALVQTLRHPHLVDVYETGMVEGRSYMVLQCIDGGNFAHLLEMWPQIALARSANIISQIASVLDYIHAEGVIHRDIKLGNILLDKTGHAYLIDFGIAYWKRASVDDDACLMPGTARYMPPEQIVKDMPFDRRADGYALGVIAYLLATGYFPFTGANDHELMVNHLTTKPALPSAVTPSLPKALDAILYKALAKRRSDRYDTAGEFAAAFANAVAQQGDLNMTLHAGTPNPGHIMSEYAHLHHTAARSHAGNDSATQFLSDAEAELHRLYTELHA